MKVCQSFDAIFLLLTLLRCDHNFNDLILFRHTHVLYYLSDCETCRKVQTAVKRNNRQKKQNEAESREIYIRFTILLAFLKSKRTR